MEDTSFAIHPGQKKTPGQSTYQDIGSFRSCEIDGHLIEIACEQGHIHFQFYRTDIVRVVMNPLHKPDMQTSLAVVKEAESVKVEAIEKKDVLVLKTEDLNVHIKKTPLRVSIYDDAERPLAIEGAQGAAYNSEGHVSCTKIMEAIDHFYGFGEKSGFLDKRDEKLTMWNTDVYAPHNPETDSLYQSIPYFMVLRDGRTHGIFFDNTFRTTFDMKSEKGTYTFSAEGGQLDYYVFAGPTPKRVLEQYTTLTGKMPLPPKWALGYHQSRYSYESEQEVRELADTFMEKGIPLDAIHLDIHYMDGYRVFTFDKGRFPTPKNMVEDLKAKGIRIVPIEDAGVKEDPEYPIYQEGVQQDLFCKYLEGNLYFGDVWPGNSAFPDFSKAATREWWGDKNKFYSDLGIEGIWNDMNEPAVFNETKTMDVKVMHENDGNPKTHRELHNVYGTLMEQATYEGMKKHLNGKRPFLLTRAGFAGIQRYSAVWTGDNRSFWEHLAMALPMCMNLGLSGVAFCGSDVGGFAHDTTGELLVRWTQAGAFLPYFRNHSALHFARQEPWAFGEKYEAIVKKYIGLRYKWLPHLYTLFKETTDTGVPVMRPLFMEYPDDRNTYQMSDEFLVGENVLVAPILTPGTSLRAVYLPEGKWYDYWTDRVYEGGRHHLIEADLETLPIFVKAGSILPEGEVRQSTAVPEEVLTVHVYPRKGDFSYTLYEDDGETFDYLEGKAFSEYFFCQYDEKKIKLEIKEQTEGYRPFWSRLRIVFHDVEPDTDIMVNGEHVNEQQEAFDHYVVEWTLQM
ncbi:MAG TPA: glycoside hydrolase family 31 protein [Bacillales bacterium]|nr:glycoside hydrolase family 31 protein [Bacillales bacterium]